MMPFYGLDACRDSDCQGAAGTIKRVSQEGSGKLPNILVDDASFAGTMEDTVATRFTNCNQTCNAPRHPLVLANRPAEAIEIARKVAEATIVDDPTGEDTALGPVANPVQFARIQDPGSDREGNS